MKIGRLFSLLAIIFVPPGVFEGLWESVRSNEPDWTEYGLDPSASGFKPEVVFIAGEVKANRSNLIEGNRYFEITARNRDQYFRREWVGREGKVGSSWRVQLVLDGFEGTMGRSKGTLGSQGGGGSGDWSGTPNDQTPLVVAQNLWDNFGFVGLTNENRIYKDEWSQTETYRQSEKRGDFKVPRKILFTKNYGTFYGGEQTTTYIVKRIEFRKEPSSAWFGEMKKKVFSSCGRAEGSDRRKRNNKCASR